MTPTLNSHTHCQAAQSQRTSQSLSKSVSEPTHGQKGKKHDCPTRGIKHWGLSGYSNILPRIKFSVTGQESSPQSPTISYRHRWA